MHGVPVWPGDIIRMQTLIRPAKQPSHGPVQELAPVWDAQGFKGRIHSAHQRVIQPRGADSEIGRRVGHAATVAQALPRGQCSYKPPRPSHPAARGVCHRVCQVPAGVCQNRGRVCQNPSTGLNKRGTLPHF